MIAVLLTAGLLNLCTQERITEGPDWESALPVQFTVSIPDENSSSRAMTTAEESSIQDVNVLAFYQSGSDYIYGYAPEYVAKTITGSQMTVTVKAKASTLMQQFVILVNASAELASAGIIPNEKLPSAMAKIICHASGEWPARNNGAGLFKAIPMYARSDAKVITGTGSIGDYPLIRMLARIDVTLKSTIPAATFVLSQGMLFNYKDMGYVPYLDASNFAGAPTFAVAAPVVPPAASSGNPILTPAVTYNAVGGAIQQMIYTYESPAYTEANKLRGTALVVGGKYNNSSTMSYYRINIKTTTEPAANYTSPILRNYQYNVEIQSVTGPGYPTALEAYMDEGHSSDLTAQVQAWNQVNRTYPIGQDEGPYLLVVSSDSFTIAKAGGSASPSFTLTSNNIAGWSIGTVTYTSSGTSWLTISPMSGGVSASPVTLTLTATSANGSASNRTAKFDITAGNMKKTITVTQSGT